MNPRERFLTTLRGGEADRVPLNLDGFHYQTLAEVEEPAKREIVERVIDQTHFLLNCPSFENRWLVTPPRRIREVSREERDGKVTVTSEINTPKGKLAAVTEENPLSQTTWTVKYPVESLADLEKLRSAPWELPAGLAPPDLSLRSPLFDERGIAHVAVSSPFVCVAGAMSYEYFLELCTRELDLIKELTAQCLERILGLLDMVLAERTIDYVWMGGSEWLTPPMASPPLYEALVQEFERPIIERIHAAGAISHIHCHGNVRSTLERVIERGGDFFEPVEPPPDGDITLAEAKALAAGRITLGGNIEARLLANESPEAVDEATRKAFEGGKRRLVLQTTAGPISPLTPRMVENYHRLIDVWEELSPL